MTDYAGIDYSHGQSNVNKNGVHFGVINQNSISHYAFEDLEPDYGPATCPNCGNEAEDISHFENKDSYAHTKYECEDYVCHSCKYVFGSESAFPDEPLAYYHESADYKICTCLDNDLMVIKSPYYTYAQFCSPCVPGAGNLESPCLTGPKTYCLGHNWFSEPEHAPYPVFSIKTGELVHPTEIIDGFNPDSHVSPEELTPWIVYFTILENVEIIYATLIEYCQEKRAAMEYRRNGNIPMALHHESNCDKIYTEIPKDSPWIW